MTAYRGADLTARMHRHADDVMPRATPPARRFSFEDHPGGAREHAPVGLPAPQRPLHPRHRAHAHCVAGKHPVANRKAVTRDRKTHNHLCGASPRLFFEFPRLRGPPPPPPPPRWRSPGGRRSYRRRSAPRPGRPDLPSGMVQACFQHVPMRLQQIHRPVEMPQIECLAPPMRTSCANQPTTARGSATSTPEPTPGNPASQRTCRVENLHGAATRRHSGLPACLRPHSRDRPLTIVRGA